jgi:hypothetical protein
LTAREPAPALERVTLADGAADQALVPGLEPISPTAHAIAQEQARRDKRRRGDGPGAGALFNPALMGLREVEAAIRETRERMAEHVEARAHAWRLIHHGEAIGERALRPSHERSAARHDIAAFEAERELRALEAERDRRLADLAECRLSQGEQQELF